MAKKELTVIVPIYNEEDSIKRILEQINRHTDSLILAVDDCSTDNSRQILLSLQKKYKNLRIISKKINKGYGAALKTGFIECRTEFLTFLDADLTYHPKYIPQLVNLVKKYSLDCAWCNRYGGDVNKMPFARKIANKVIVLAFLLWTFKYIPDVTSGQRVYRTKSMMSLNPKTLPNGLDMISALTKRTVARGLKYKIIPCNYGGREGSSKISAFRDGFRMIKNILLER
jgi:glycosyltransferase involved in cell wall biosynthesis